MKRLVCLILLLCFVFLCSCDSIKPYNETKGDSKITVEEPTEDSLEDYALETTDETTVSEDIAAVDSNISEPVQENTNDGEFDGTYYANTNTHKFHRSDCSSAKLIKDKNLYITTSREELINGGYSPCLRCNP